MSKQDNSNQWAIVEIFGHKTVAGKVTKDTSLFPMLRIDVPATTIYPSYTIEHGPSAVFSILYVSEDIARSTAEALKIDPITVYNPELITREQFDRMQDEYRQSLAKLRALPKPNDENDNQEDVDEFPF